MVIVTHNSKFHTDDVCAVAILSLVLSDKEVEIMRTRDQEMIDRADYVVDVGGIYDPEKNRFDHHQTGGAGKRANGVEYASFGLVWKKYGERIAGSVEIAEIVDKKMVQPIDAEDNGMSIIKPMIEELYPYDFSSFIYSLNPSWKEGIDVADEKFLMAVSYASTAITRIVAREKDKIEAARIVSDIYTRASDKRLIIFDRFYPSDDVLKEYPEPLFVIYPREDDTWVIESIMDNPITYASRKSLPAAWAGLRDTELEKVTGVPGAVFCHRGCFIAVARTKEAIMKLAEIALE